MLGVIVNTAAVVIGSLLGLLFRRGIPDKLSRAAMTGIALCTLYLGVSGSLGGRNAIVTILAVVLGAVLGTMLGIDRGISALGHWVQGRSRGGPGEGPAPLGEGFVTASLLFCVGSMTIVGSLNAGLAGDNEMLFAKSVLDFISSIMLSVTLGAGVLFSAVFVFLFQGAIVLSAQLLRPLLTEPAVAEMSCAGSILIIGLGLNLLGVTKIKVADCLPAIALAPLFSYLYGLVG